MKHLLLLIVIGFFATNLSGQQFHTNNNTDTQETVAHLDFKVFPNPAIDYIQISDNTVVEQVTVYNLVGRQVKSYRYELGEKFYIGDLPQGMYLVQLIGDKNNVLTTKRINIR